MSTTFRLLGIPGVPPDWETEHKVYAVEVNGHCCVRGFIEELRKSPSEYKKVMKVIRLVAGSHRVKNPLHVKQHKEHSGIYEMIAHTGNSRISFFYGSPPDEDVICVLDLWKEFGHTHKQDTFFEHSVEIMNLYRSI